jgi:N-carbamoyl-L-amino-acid hydrolase
MCEAGADPGRLGPDPERHGSIAAFVELHVEQGRGLDQAVGVGSAIWPHGRWRMGFEGTPDHAGTTRLPDRHDPMLPLAQVVLATRAAAASHQALATVGRVVVVPNATNGVAGQVSAWLDARSPHQSRLDATVEAVRQAGEKAAAEHGVRFRFVAESFTPRVELDPGLRRRVQEVLGGLPELETGAGHDAAILAGALPTAILVVRNPTGVSHSPLEAASEEDCVAGVLALARVLEDLSR